MEEFVARRSRGRIALMIVACGGFVGLGLWLIGAFGELSENTRYSPAAKVGVGCLAIVLFGYVGLTLIRSLFDDSERLRINASGIYWQDWSDQTIPWTEITDITIWEYRLQRFIILHLQNASRFPCRGMQAPFSAINRALTGGDIAITLAATDRSFNDAMAAIATFRN